MDRFLSRVLLRLHQHFKGEIIIAAFADSYNQLVKVVRNYRAQTVKGGLGTGGALGVQGGSTPAAPK